MAYSDFTTITKARIAFDLVIAEDYLFTDVEPIEPSQYLQQTLRENLRSHRTAPRRFTVSPVRSSFTRTQVPLA